ncbi:MAG: Crp/Fnr family transcriptional regulator [Sutterellaceae bacterium]|nr:Crp/Fnr family transcriptional regulator [Sutterellaceae bacterium]MDY2867254.1 Crp/Fnr family transcriptional regulator [Mesosutterella sp.]
MRQVFLTAPWVHAEEPEELRAVFQKYGKLQKFPKGHFFPHGADQDGGVALIQKGLVFFYFVDNESKNRIFAILPPNRVVGDLDALTRYRLNIFAVTMRPTEALVVSGEAYCKALDSDPALMRCYAMSSITKEETHLEGMMAIFTLPLEKRLIALYSSIIGSYYPLKRDDWNPVPFKLTTFEIADIVGSNRSTISTIVNHWISEGLARRDGRWLHLHGKLFAREYDWLKNPEP